MIKKILLTISTILVISCSSNAVEITHDGMPVVLKSGDSTKKTITFINREAIPSWVRLSLSSVGPLSPEKVAIAQKNSLDASAIGWTQVKQGWVEVASQKIITYPVQIMPPTKTTPGRYVVWVVIEQIKERPKAMSGEQRGGIMLETQAVETYYLPVVVTIEQ